MTAASGSLAPLLQVFVSFMLATAHDVLLKQPTQLR